MKITTYANFLENQKVRKNDIVLYAADTPNSWKVASVLEELKVEYDVKLVDLSKDEQKDSEYLKLNPNGRTPTLLDYSNDVVEKNNGAPFAVFESGAIMMYLTDKFSDNNLYSYNDPFLRSEIQQWLFFQVSGIGPAIGNCMYFKRIAAPITSDISKLEFSIQRFENESIRLLTVLNDRLNGRDFLCGKGKGSFTLADIACYGYAASYWWAGIDLKGHNLLNVLRWLTLLGEKKSIKEGCLVPGVSNFGAKGPIFEKMRVDLDLQSRIELHAKDNSRQFFGWKDLSHMFADSSDNIPFSTHVCK